MVNKNNNKTKITTNTFKFGRPIIAEKLVKQAWERNSGLESISNNYCAQNLIQDARTQNDLTLLAKFNGVRPSLIKLMDGKNSHAAYLINATLNDYIHPSDKLTLYHHDYILKQYNKLIK